MNSLTHIHNKELALVIMEAEKSQDLESANYRLRRVDGVVPVQVQKVENQESK